MSKHYYAFGSICRGEVDASSDVDLLACVSEPDTSIDPKTFSIYTPQRLTELWKEGNPFAWHLHLESKLLFSSDGSDILASLGTPSPYQNMSADCRKFHTLFVESFKALQESHNSEVFHLSCMFLSVRNFATCHSFETGIPIFSRKSPLLIDSPLPVCNRVFDVFTRARILSTRGIGVALNAADVNLAINSCPSILEWMDSLSTEVVI